MNVPARVKCDACPNTRPDTSWSELFHAEEIRKVQELMATWSTYDHGPLRLDLCPDCTTSVRGLIEAWCKRIRERHHGTRTGLGGY